MVSIVTKRIKGKSYIYLVASMRDGEVVRQKTLKYLGIYRPLPEEERTCHIRSASP